LMSAGIEAVVELADNEAFAPLPRHLIRCRFPLSDDGENPVWLLRLTAESIAHLVRSSVPAVICCSGGMSRSACMAAAGIALAEGRRLGEAMPDVCRGGPVDVSPALIASISRCFANQL
jgi:protein-tyrosine phosphatase